MTPDQGPRWAGDSSLTLTAPTPCLDSTENIPLHGDLVVPEAVRALLPSFICQIKLPLFFLTKTKPPPDVLRWAGGALEWARALQTIGCTSGRRKGWDCLSYAWGLTSVPAACSDFPHGGIQGPSRKFKLPLSSLQAAAELWAQPSQGAGLHSTVTDPDCFMQKFGHFVTFFFFFTLDHVVFLLVRNFHGKVRIRVCIFFFLLLLFFTTSPKDLREIAEMISS